MPIAFYNADLIFKLKHKQHIKEFLNRKVIKTNKQIKKIIYVFCSDDYLLHINQQFLKHDYYTDIITFPLGDNPNCLEAEIYISIDRVRENSLRFAIEGQQQGKNLHLLFEQELKRVVFHGILHLLGQKDKTHSQKQKMRELEDVWLNDFSDFIKKSNT